MNNTARAGSGNSSNGSGTKPPKPIAPIAKAKPKLKIASRGPVSLLGKYKPSPEDIRSREVSKVIEKLAGERSANPHRNMGEKCLEDFF